MDTSPLKESLKFKTSLETEFTRGAIEQYWCATELRMFGFPYQTPGDLNWVAQLLIHLHALKLTN